MLDFILTTGRPSAAFDGLGSPSDHIAWCKENGLDAWAATNHGQMNSYANAALYVEKLNKGGDNFKFIPGCELYIHPDLEQWKKDYELDKTTKADEKEKKKQAKKELEKIKTLIDVEQDPNGEVIEMTNSLTIENEDESKGSTKFFKPVNRRHHLVVLPKNSNGLLDLFKLVSVGYLDGFYRFPRIDFKALKEAGKKGNLIASSACLAGPMSWETLRVCQEVEFDKLNATILNDATLLDRAVKNVGLIHERLIDCLGEENAFLEIQFNRLGAQDLVNRAIIEYARRSNFTKQLIVTCDSHYPRPESWLIREVYKKLGWMKYQDFTPDMLPKSREELKCELYPKNATQVWEEYQNSKVREGNEFYDDTEIFDAIERTHDIAHNVIGDVKLDKTPRYPTKIVPVDTTAFKMLTKLTIEGLRQKKLDKNKEYVDRLKFELGVIKQMDNAAYFVTLSKMLSLARDVVLLGVARGSCGGSLVCYLCSITDLDPIKYKCRFDRFMNPHRVGLPDADIDVSDRDKVLDVFRKEFGFNNVLPISNVNVFKIKSLLKDLSKFNGVPFDEANEATRTVEQEVRKATHEAGADKNLFVLTYDDAMKHSPSFLAFIEKYPAVGEHMKSLFKEQKSLGRHAGGVIILDDAASQIPIITSKGEPQMPFGEGVAQKTCEPLGYIKYDILGLETMRLIERTISLIISQKLGKLIQLEFDDDNKIELYENEEVKLTTGEFIRAKDLNENHDVMIPFVKNGTSLPSTENKVLVSH